MSAAARPVRNPFQHVVAEVMRLRGVQGAIVVDAADGIPIASTLDVGVDGDAVAALAASLFQRAAAATVAAGYGSAAYVQLEGEHGWLCVTGQHGMVLAAVAEPRTNVALLRLALLRAREHLA
jgi:predicted regulator of Ras-like GTPase activity (Roadblock/LC7/MglB family)